MKTATIRELRNRFAEVAKWLDSGEEVTITRRGNPFATLSPFRKPHRRSVNWADRFKNHRPVGKALTTRATARFWETLRD